MKSDIKRKIECTVSLLNKLIPGSDKAVVALIEWDEDMFTSHDFHVLDRLYHEKLRPDIPDGWNPENITEEDARVIGNAICLHNRIGCIIGREKNDDWKLFAQVTQRKGHGNGNTKSTKHEDN